MEWLAKVVKTSEVNLDLIFKPLVTKFSTNACDVLSVICCASSLNVVLSCGGGGGMFDDTTPQGKVQFGLRKKK